MQPVEQYDSKKSKAIRYAIFATCFICIGSFFIIVAPGDGQTGACAFPLMLIGLIFAIVSICHGGLNRENRGVVGGLAVTSALLLLSSYVACLEVPSKPSSSTESLSNDHANK